MKIKYNSDIISGGLFAILAAVIWLLIPSQIQTMETTAVTAQTIPRIVIGGMFIFSLVLLLQGLFMTPKKSVYIDKAFFQSEKFKKEMKSILFAAILIVFCFLISTIGFIISSLLLVVAILVFYGARKWYYYAISMSTVALVYFIFKIVLSVNLP
ncbi:tripartite tricarboxylate transporter TctB family protein [Vallitalea okinawensis]|uniref:tripartite tricarboxylate transporter TctB family protein n=1 Tax=Vallitalea okinawensis TaxID=2078660 RepID=UPI000CFBA79A|nr:tripartite tricarboxylate transporter TctB family protein [Vallitalea okinawensis]